MYNANSFNSNNKQVNDAAGPRLSTNPVYCSPSNKIIKNMSVLLAYKVLHSHLNDLEVDECKFAQLHHITRVRVFSYAHIPTVGSCDSKTDLDIGT